MTKIPSKYFDKYAQHTVDTYIKNVEDNKLCGLQVCCQDCSYTWTIRKVKGLPSKCPNCLANKVKIDEEYCQEQLKETVTKIIEMEYTKKYTPQFLKFVKEQEEI